MTDQLVIARQEHTTGVLELNRPRALNSLTSDMVRIIDQHLDEWATDPQITQVLIYSNSPKAFCAGGDVRLAREYLLAGTPELADEFFAAEYVMNGNIAHFPKPYIALIDGIAMGGGLGISAHGSHRIVTENALAAMPEMAIGFMPDVGMSYMMQHMVGTYGRKSPAVARFLAITGYRLDPADMLYTGLATHYVPRQHLDALHRDIIQHGVDKALTTYQETPSENPQLKTHIDGIEAAFGHPTWDEIDHHLTGELRNLVHQHIAHASPSAIVAALELITAAGTKTDIRHELALEIPFGEYIRRQPDFAEGVRAVLVDKRPDAQFQPKTFADVDPAPYRKILSYSAADDN